MSRDPIGAISLDDQGMFLSCGYFQAVFSNKVSFILLDNGENNLQRPEQIYWYGGKYATWAAETFRECVDMILLSITGTGRFSTQVYGFF